MITEHKTHLEITDLPRDNLGILYGVRKPLVRAFNKCRSHPYKMTLLKEFLKFMYNSCVAFEKHHGQSQAVEPKVPETAGESPETATKAVTKEVAKEVAKAVAKTPAKPKK